MNRIKYPKQKVIDVQISQILDRSGLFSDENVDELDGSGSQEFVKCTPVKEKRLAQIVKLTSAVAAAAAALIMAITIYNYIPIKQTRQQPLSLGEYDTIDENHMQYNSASIRNTDVVCYKTAQLEEITGNDAASDSTVYGELKFNQLEVTYKGNILQEVETMVNGFVQAEEDTNIKQMYMQYSSGASMAQVNVSLDFEPMDPILKNSNIISVVVTKNVDISVRKNFESSNIIQNEQYGYSYDVTTGKQILLEDLFQNEAGMEVLENRLIEYIRMNHINADEKTILNKVLTDGSWFFSSEGICFLYQQNILKQDFQSEATMQNEIMKYTVPYSDILYLNDDYK